MPESSVKNKRKVEFYRHTIGEEEILEVTEVLRGVILTTGSKVAEFEEHFARYLRIPFAAGLSSGTAALELMLRCMGIGPGDEVITTPLTFIASANAILEVGATPVFADVEEATGLIDPAAVERAVTSSTKAILPVHLYGRMCDMKALSRIAQKFGLKILEDAAHCIEGERDGIRPGQLADAAAFSFYATKNITSGEGGAAVFKNPEWLTLLRKLRNHGMSQEAGERYGKAVSHWDMEILGGKFNMTNIQAALLLPQLRKIETYLARRSEIALRYRARLAALPGIKILKEIPNSRNACHLFPVFVERDQRDTILWGLREMGIGCTVNYHPVPLTRYYRERFQFAEGRFPAAEKLGFSTLSLPFHIYLTEDEQNYVVDSLKTLLQGACLTP